MIAFDQIPSGLRKPGKYFEYNTTLAVRGLVPDRERLLLIGQRTAAGQTAALVPVPMFSDAEAATAFGRGSQLHRMVKAALTANPYIDLTAIAVDDAETSLAATTGVDVLLAPSVAGSLTLRVGADAISVGFAAGEEAAALATTLNNLIASRQDLPVVSSVVGIRVTLTAKNKGDIAKLVPISVDCTVAEMMLVTSLGEGFLNPDLSPALDAVFAGDYDVIVIPNYNPALDDGSLALRDHLAALAGPMEQRPAVGVMVGDPGQGIAETGYRAGSALNSGYLVMAYLPGSPTIPYEVAAAFGAVLAGESDPARPLNTLALRGVAPPTIATRLSRNEQESLLWTGVTPLEVGPGEQVQIVRAVTTYTQNAAGAPDPALLDVTTPRTLAYVRRVLKARLALRFPRSKVNDRTVRAIRTEILDVCQRCEALEILENVATVTKPGLVVERDANDPNRVNASIPVDVVNGLHIFAGRIDLLL